MTLAFAQLPCFDSPLRRVDARWKLAAFALAVGVTALLRTVPATATALAGAAALAAAGCVPARWLLARLGAAFLFLLPFVLTVPFLLADPGVDKPWWQPTWRGTAFALVLAGKALAVITLVLVLLTSAPLSDTLKAAHALRVPGLLVQLFALTYRYLFLIADEMGRLRIALRVRGFRNRPTRHGYRTVGHVAGTLLVRGHERGERVGQAMRCRGFDGRFRSLADFRTAGGDVVFFLLAAAGWAGLLGWDLSQ